jgi:BMFP domain-containing protein YqiC
MDKIMTQREKILDDLARLAGGGISMMSGFGQQVQNEIRSRVDDAISRLDLVSRREFEELEDLVKDLAAENAKLKKDIKGQGVKTPPPVSP